MAMGVNPEIDPEIDPELTLTHVLMSLNPFSFFVACFCVSIRTCVRPSKTPIDREYLRLGAGLGSGSGLGLRLQLLLRSGS